MLFLHLTTTILCTQQLTLKCKLSKYIGAATIRADVSATLPRQSGHLHSQNAVRLVCLEESYGVLGV
jgi:hypothetical protein